MSYRRDKGLVCDGCQSVLIEGDVSTMIIRVVRSLQMNISQFELCPLCASKERANHTVLGKFLESNLDSFGKPQ